MVVDEAALPELALEEDLEELAVVLDLAVVEVEAGQLVDEVDELVGVAGLEEVHEDARVALHEPQRCLDHPDVADLQLVGLLDVDLRVLFNRRLPAASPSSPSRSSSGCSS